MEALRLALRSPPPLRVRPGFAAGGAARQRSTAPSALVRWHRLGAGHLFVALSAPPARSSPLAVWLARWLPRPPCPLGPGRPLRAMSRGSASRQTTSSSLPRFVTSMSRWRWRTCVRPEPPRPPRRPTVLHTHCTSWCARRSVSRLGHRLPTRWRPLRHIFGTLVHTRPPRPTGGP